MTWDTDLFLWLNFDGGAFMDSLMLFASGKLSWIPFYLLILWLIYRKSGWKAMLFALVAIGCAVGISDLVAGIFKHTGPLKHLWESFPARLRPMHTPELEGLIHVIKGGGKFGTVSAHASTATSIVMIASLAIGKRWFSVIATLQCVTVCYSRIYLAYHYPQDIILGVGVGLFSGYVMWSLYKLALSKTLNNE
ncbi:MAG: phosphatase PAP2 family protein [Rikenellaceae bacterium]